MCVTMHSGIRSFLGTHDLIILLRASMNHTRAMSGAEQETKPIVK